MTAPGTTKLTMTTRETLDRAAAAAAIAASVLVFAAAMLTAAFAADRGPETLLAALGGFVAAVANAAVAWACVTVHRRLGGGAPLRRLPALAAAVLVVRDPVVSVSTVAAALRCAAVTAQLAVLTLTAAAVFATAAAATHNGGVACALAAVCAAAIASALVSQVCAGARDRLRHGTQDHPQPEGTRP